MFPCSVHLENILYSFIRSSLRNNLFDKQNRSARLFVQAAKIRANEKKLSLIKTKKINYSQYWQNFNNFFIDRWVTISCLLSFKMRQRVGRHQKLCYLEKKGILYVTQFPQVPVCTTSFRTPCISMIITNLR